MTKWGHGGMVARPLCIWFAEHSKPELDPRSLRQLRLPGNKTNFPRVAGPLTHVLQDNPPILKKSKNT